MAAKGKVYVTGFRRSGDRTYSVTVNLEIGYNFGGWSQNARIWSISADAIPAQTGSSFISVPSGNGNWIWSLMGTKTFSITMSEQGAAKTIELLGSVYPDFAPTEVHCKGSFTLPALSWQWPVTYDANGGYGAPQSDVKNRGVLLTLSREQPQRDGYIFLGWSTNKDANVPEYKSSSRYEVDDAAILYAVWQKNKYTISYNANSGKGAPESQTKLYGDNIRLSEAIPTLTNYDFLGWSKQSFAANATWAPGATFTENANTTLYAIWKLSYWNPRLANLQILRTDENGNQALSGTFCFVKFNFDICTNGITNKVKSCKVVFGNGITKTLDAKLETHGTLAVNAGPVPTETATSVNVTLTDEKGGTNSINGELDPIEYTMDFKDGGTSVAFGKPATEDRLIESGWNIRVAHSRSNHATCLQIKRGNIQTWLAASEANNNRGIYDKTAQSWLFYTDGTNPMIDGSRPMYAQNTNGYMGIAWADGMGKYNDSNFVRTTSSGIIPYSSGGASQVGSSSWPFNQIHSKAYYVNGTNMSDFIIAQNVPTTVDQWGYIKYNSGICVCYRLHRITSCSAGYNSFSVSTPFSIQWAYSCSANVSVDNQGQCYVCYTRMPSVNNANIWFNSPTSGYTLVSITIWGRWK